MDRKVYWSERRKDCVTVIYIYIYIYIYMEIMLMVN